MIYVVHLYECDEQHLSLFTSSFDYDGLLQKIAKNLPGHLHTQIRPHSSLPHVYLAIEFWLTEGDYLRARRSVAFQAREAWLQAMTVARMDFGIFLPRVREIDEMAMSRQA